MEKKTIVMILDNFSSHRAEAVRKEAEKLGIHLVFLPPYSPDLNPIEFVWKSLKKLISEVFIGSVDELKSFIKEKIPILFRNRGYKAGLRSFLPSFKKFSAPIFAIYWRNDYNLPVNLGKYRDEHTRQETDCKQVHSYNNSYNTRISHDS